MNTELIGDPIEQIEREFTVLNHEVRPSAVYGRSSYFLRADVRVNDRFAVRKNNRAFDATTGEFWQKLKIEIVDHRFFTDRQHGSFFHIARSGVECCRIIQIASRYSIDPETKIILPRRDHRRRELSV